MRLGHFDLNLFVVLDALLETRSITRAGERLRIGASATSSALGRLREHFGDELLVRVGRRMEPTALALTLREPVRDLLLRSQATLAAQTRFDPGSTTRRFVFNASDYVVTVLLAPFARELEREAPGISIDAVAFGGDNTRRLEQGDVDIAVYPAHYASGEHPQTRLFDDDYSCVVWTGFQLPGDELRREQFLTASHVVARFGDSRLAAFDESFLAGLGVTRRVAVTASSFNALPLLVIGTQRIATMQTRLARCYEALLPLRILKPPFDIPAIALVMQWNRHNDRDAAHCWLRERLAAFSAAI